MLTYCFNGRSLGGICRMGILGETLQLLAKGGWCPAQGRVGFHCNKFIFWVLQIEIGKNWSYKLKLWVRQLWIDLSLLDFRNRKDIRQAGSGWLKVCPEPMAKAWEGLGSPTSRSLEVLVVPLQPMRKINGGFHQSREWRCCQGCGRMVLKAVGWKGFNTENSPIRWRIFSWVFWTKPWPPWLSAGGRPLPLALPWGCEKKGQCHSTQVSSRLCPAPPFPIWGPHGEENNAFQIWI